jgi:hypothetical protein
MLACSGSAFSAVARSRRCRILRFLGGALGEKFAVSAHAAKAIFVDGRDGLVEEAQSEV